MLWWQRKEINTDKKKRKEINKQTSISFALVIVNLYSRNDEVILAVLVCNNKEFNSAVAAICR